MLFLNLILFVMHLHILILVDILYLDKPPSGGLLWNSLYVFKIHSSPISPFTLTNPLVSRGYEAHRLRLVTPKSDSSKGFAVEVYDTEGKLLHQFDSISTAAKSLGIHKTTIRRSADKSRLCKGVYFFKLGLHLGASSSVLAS